ncbi:MAG: GNAT family N-acetyltransferase [Candidatus Hodarchaeota archaeon]
MDIEFVPFNVQTASREEWELFHEFRRKRSAEHSPGDPIWDDKTIETFLKSMEREWEVYGFAIFEIGKPKTQIGILRLGYFRESSSSYTGNEKNCQIFSLAVLSPYRRKGIGRKMLAKACELAKKHNKPILIGNTIEADGKAFIRKIGAQEALEAIENRMVLNQIDWDMVERWAKEGPEQSPNSRIEFFTSVPEEIIDPYCKIYTETFNQQPFGELQIGDTIFSPEIRRKQEADFRKTKAQWMTLITREEDGDISGLTEMLYQPDRPTMIQQMLTGVQEKYRGTGKGKWLKALMLLRIREEFPQVEIVTTGNATTNAPMISINQRLGFKRHKEIILGQITVDKIDEFLAKE